MCGFTITNFQSFGLSKGVGTISQMIFAMAKVPTSGLPLAFVPRIIIKIKIDNPKIYQNLEPFLIKEQNYRFNPSENL